MQSPANPVINDNFHNGANIVNDINVVNGADGINLANAVIPANAEHNYSFLLLPLFVIWFSYFSCACANVVTIHIAHPDKEVLLYVDFIIFIVQLLGVVIAGRISDYITTKKVLLFVIGALIIYFLLMSNATDASTLYLASLPRAFVFLTLVQMIATAELTCIPHRHLAFGWIVAFESLGQVAGLAWGYFFITVFGVKQSFLMAAILSAFAMFILWKGFPEIIRNPPVAGFWTGFVNCSPVQIIQACYVRRSVVCLITAKFLLDLSFVVMKIKLMSTVTCHPRLKDNTFWVVFLQPLLSLPVAVALIPFLCHSFPIQSLLITDAVLILVSYLFLITVKSFLGFVCSIFFLSNELIFWFVVNAGLITRNIPEAELGTFLGLYTLTEFLNCFMAKIVMTYIHPHSTDICIHTFGGIGFALTCVSLIFTKAGLANLRDIQRWPLQ